VNADDIQALRDELIYLPSEELLYRAWALARSDVRLEVLFRRALDELTASEGESRTLLEDFCFNEELARRLA
jgi:hypothetical protein